MALKAGRRQYETRVGDLEEQMRELQVSFRKCSSQKWRVFWQPRMTEAEDARHKLEEGRSKLMQLRRTLESDPGPTNVPLYCSRVQDELIYGYDGYIEDMRSYIALVDASIDLCERRDFTEGAVEVAGNHLRSILKAVGRLADTVEILKGS